MKAVLHCLKFILVKKQSLVLRCLLLCLSYYMILKYTNEIYQLVFTSFVLMVSAFWFFHIEKSVFKPRFSNDFYRTLPLDDKTILHCYLIEKCFVLFPVVFNLFLLLKIIEIRSDEFSWMTFVNIYISGILIFLYLARSILALPYDHGHKQKFTSVLSNGLKNILFPCLFIIATSSFFVLTAIFLKENLEASVTFVLSILCLWMFYEGIKILKDEKNKLLTWMTLTKRLLGYVAMQIFILLAVTKTTTNQSNPDLAKILERDDVKAFKLYKNLENVKLANKINILNYATYTKSYKIVEHLLKNKYEYNSEYCLKDTCSQINPLHIAVLWNKDVQMTKLILDHGHDPNSLADNFPVLDGPIFSCNEKLFNVLADNPRTDLNMIINPQGQRPLQRAIVMDCYPIAKTLIEKGVDLNFVDQGGQNLDYYIKAYNMPLLMTLVDEKRKQMREVASVGDHTNTIQEP